MSVCWVLPSYRSTLTTCTICTCTTTCTYTKCWLLPGAPSLLVLFVLVLCTTCTNTKCWVLPGAPSQLGQYQVLVCSSKTMSCRCSGLPDVVCLCVQRMCLEFETFCVQGIPWIGNFIVSARTGLALMNPLKDLRIAKSKGAI